MAPLLAALVTVIIHNPAHVPPDVLTRAQAHIEQLFVDAGVLRHLAGALHFPPSQKTAMQVKLSTCCRVDATRSAAGAQESSRINVPGDALALTSASRVRSLDPWLLRALDDGLLQSATLRFLVRTLEVSDVIVYLQEGVCRDAAACTMIAPTPGPGRLLRVNFVLRTPQGATMLLCHRDRLIAQIGHELQHAVEISSHRDVVDDVTLSNFFRRIGHRRSRASEYETEAAIQTGRLVLEELHSSHRSAP